MTSQMRRSMWWQAWQRLNSRPYCSQTQHSSATCNFTLSSSALSFSAASRPHLPLDKSLGGMPLTCSVCVTGTWEPHERLETEKCGEQEDRSKHDLDFLAGLCLPL